MEKAKILYKKHVIRSKDNNKKNSPINNAFVYSLKICNNRVSAI